MIKSDAAAVAELHRVGIHTGFLSSLGSAFLKQLYAAIPACPGSFGFVWVDHDREVGGFIACALSTGRFYRQALLRRGVLMAIPLARFIFSPSIIRRMWETLRYPSQAGEDLPRGEVLSIVVAEGARGKGVAGALMVAAMEEFARRGVESAKVVVWSENEVANRFYRKCGFKLVLQRQHHGLDMNIYAVDTRSTASPPATQ
jgi:ribosomal protein S18 acetylase RimI-like enzyme